MLSKTSFSSVSSFFHAQESGKIISFFSLIQLDLASVGLETFPRHFFKGLRFLKKLNIADNNLQAVPTEVIYNGEDWEELIIDQNPIVELRSHSFNGMNALKSLSISYMPTLSSIHEAAFSSLGSLQTLRMEGNEMLGFIDPDAFVEFQYPMILKELYLSGNFLRYLPRELLPELKDVKNTSLQVFQIDGNQWECDCHNIWMIELLKSERFSENAKAAKCTRPSHLKGISFAELTLADLPCEHEDDFDPTKADFGLPHPNNENNRGDSKAVFLTLASFCIVAIVGSVAFVTILQMKRNRKINYNRLAGFKIQFQRRANFEAEMRDANLDNTVYRENPTTIPL